MTDASAEYINRVLDDYNDAAIATEHEASRWGETLDKPELRAEIERRYIETVVTRTSLVPLLAPPTPVATPPTFFDHCERWIAQETHKVSVHTGRKLSDSTSWAHRPCSENCKLSTNLGLEITFAGLNQAFYDGLRDYMLGEADRSPSIFNTYVKRLRSFLLWA